MGTKIHDVGLADAMGIACSIIEELAAECRESYDSLQNTNFANSERTSALGECADTLERIEQRDEPKDPALLAIRVSWTERTGRRLSRADRLANAFDLLSAINESEVYEDIFNTQEDNSKHEVHGLKEWLDETLSTLEGVEFPGR